MKDALVSFIVPCFNGEKTIHRLLDSLLEQTYKKLEVVIVDDGSTDGSANIIETYRLRFEDAGMILTYFYQKNRGLGGAIDAGLKLFHGDYLCWVDVDDFFAPDSVALRLQFLQEHPEYSIVTSDAYIVREHDINTPVSLISKGVTNNSDPHQFWSAIEADTIFCAGCHMVRTEDFLKANPTRSIYPARRGQNWQLLLPIFYHFKRAFLDKPLFYYVSTSNSMSDDQGDEEKELYRCDEHELILTKTLESINMTPADREKAMFKIKANYTRKRLYIGVKQGNSALARREYKKLKELSINTWKDLLQVWLSKSSFLRKVYCKLR